VRAGQPGRAQSERGAALVVALMATAAVAALVAAGLLNTAIERLVAAGYRDREEARYLLDAALERAVADLATMADWTPALNGSVRSRFVDGPPSGVRRAWATAAPASSEDAVDLNQVVAIASCGHVTGCQTGDITRVTAERPWGINNPRWQLFGYGTDAMLMTGSPSIPFSLPQGRTYLVVLIGDDADEKDGDPGSDAAVGEIGHDVVDLEGHVFGARGLHLSRRLTLERGVMPADYGAGLARGIRVLARRDVRNAG
jgi:hypothetical protein